VLLVELHGLPDGFDGLLRALEVPHVDLLAFEHLVVLEKALQLEDPVQMIFSSFCPSSTMCIIPIGRTRMMLRAWTVSCITTSRSSGSSSSPRVRGIKP
jgi:hypothetical protein